MSTDGGLVGLNLFRGTRVGRSSSSRLGVNTIGLAVVVLVLVVIIG